MESEFYLIGHRGTRTDFDENSLIAFERAVENNANYIEFDVRMSKDDEIVVLHDSTINRTTNGSGKIKNMSLPEIKKYKLKMNEGQISVNVLNSSLSINPSLPSTVQLDQNYPNPFNPETTIHFSLPKESLVDLTIYNVLGQRIRNLISQKYAAGEHDVNWDGRDDSGEIVNSGVYLYRIKAGDFTDQRKMTFMK